MAWPYEARPGASLTVRETQICELAARAWTNKEIAVDLHMAEQTVKNHLVAAFKKLRVSTRMELARLWMEGSGARSPQPGRPRTGGRRRCTVDPQPVARYRRPWDWEGVAA